MAKLEDLSHSISPQDYPADKARGGEIILRTRVERVIFFAGLFGAVVLATVLEFAGILSS